MQIRLATPDDFEQIYKIGKNTPEIKTSSTDDFMDPNELKYAMTNPNCVFLVAEENKRIIGFEYASIKDIEKPFGNKYACLVYIVVMPEFRRKGVAQKLYLECEKRLKKMNVVYVYCWANVEGNGEIINFRKKQGFSEGHKYVWMDKKLK